MQLHANTGGSKIFSIKRLSLMMRLTFLLTAVSFLQANAKGIITGGGSDFINPQQLITGRVTDSSGNPLSGVSIFLKGSKTGTTTNSQGEFSIKIPDGAAAVLEFSAVGYAAETIDAEGKSNLNVILKTIAGTLNDVVVVGYGSEKRVNLTGAVATVNMANTLDKPATSLTNALQGAIPGMTIVSTLGDVGQDVGTISIRGQGNLSSSSPMFVVDGVPVSSSDFARISPSDIASISVLKDASSAAIYGSRAAYGVLLVTTKSGAAGDKAHIAFNTYYGTQKAIYLPSYTNATQYATLANEAAANANKAPLYNAAQLDTIANGSDVNMYPNNNWYNIILRNSAPLTDNQLSISGGGTTRYYLSGDFMDQNSLLPSERLLRYSLRSNLSSQISKIFKISSNLSFIRDAITDGDGIVSILNMNRMLPLTVNVQDNGDWGSITAGQIDAVHASNNPDRQMLDGGWHKQYTNRFLGTLQGDLTPMQGLDITGSVSYNSISQKGDTFYNQMTPIVNFFTGNSITGTGQASSLQSTWTTSSVFLAQLYGSYEKKIQEHYGKLMLGTSYEDDQNSFLGAFRDSFPSNSLSVINAGSVDANINNEGDQQQRTFISYFGRFNYSYKERYLLEVNMRIDGSSQFPAGYQWGTFPSVSAGWRISQEPFMKNATWVNNLKLRASWGKLGNVNNVGYYNYNNLVPGPTGVLSGSLVNGVTPQSYLISPTLTWETVTMTDVGVDADLFHHLSVQLDAYNKVTNNILLNNYPVPLETGFYQEYINGGKVSNKGIELNLSYGNNIGKVGYKIFGNMTKIWNKVLSVGNGQSSFVASDGLHIYQVGKPVGSFYMYKAQGLFTDSAEILASATQPTAVYPGSIKYANIDGNSTIDGNDRTIVGNSVPYFNYALGFNVNYAGFDLTVQGQGVGGVKVYLNGEASQAFFNGANVPSYVLKGWTAQNPNPNAPYPRVLFTADDPQATLASSFWLFNASYFRIKTATLGYTLPKSLTTNWHIQSLRFYLSSNNLFTIKGDKRLNFDPEAPTSRGNYYPSTRTVTFGLNLNL